MTTEYTKNFRLNLPDFRMGPWHDLINDNTVTIDELLLSILQGVNTSVWTNNTPYTTGMTVIDETNGSFWVCSVSHTSASLPTTFAEDRAANPTYWTRIVVGIAPRGEWQNDTLYLVNDMVNDSTEGVIAVCITEHTSSALPATIRTDEVYWSFIADMSAGGDAIGIRYDNTVSGVVPENVQDALDLTFANDAANAATGAENTSDIAALEARVTYTEDVNTTQDATISGIVTEIGVLDSRVDAIEGAGYLTDAPIDGEFYARKDGTWSQIDTASVLVSDIPPDAPDNALWWESDTGQLYIKYNDGTSSQWILAVPQTSAASIGAATPAYVDAADALRVLKTGDTMTGALAISDTTASSSTTTGALKVSGGAGIAGNLNAGGAIVAGGAVKTTGSAGAGAGGMWTQSGYGTVFAAGAASPASWQFAFFDSTISVNYGGFNAAGNWHIARNTASSNPSTGALTVVGGAGIGGDANVYGRLYAQAGGYTLPGSNVAAKIAYAGGGIMYGLAFRPQTDSTIAILFSNAADVISGTIYQTATTVAYNTSSDGRLKDDLKSFDAGNVIDNTNVYDFAWKTTGERAYGVIAQQAIDVYPAAVTYVKEMDWYGIDYSKYVPVLLQELKALRIRVAELEAKVV